MATVALRIGLLGAALAAAMAFAGPAGAQMFSDGFKFLKAVEEKDGAVATELLDEPGSTVVNARDISTGRTGLHIAAERRDLTWIAFLAQKGANPNIADKTGSTPLMLAVRLGFVEGASALLDVGAMVDVKDSTGETPLISAVHARNYEMMRVLLEAGADPDLRDNSGRSARAYAALNGSSDLTVQTLERHEKPASERADQGAVYGPSF